MHVLLIAILIWIAVFVLLVAFFVGADCGDKG